ncbi:MAG: ATP-binding protein [Rhodobacteraceae bacterium]|nr:MAG: ATP-binding protein [Paracoccaceae bacterium]
MTSTRRGPKSLAAWLASAPVSAHERLLDRLTPETLAALPHLFEFWGRADHQLPPPGDWSTWVVLGGRGSGKTRAGAEWVRRQVEGATPAACGLARRVALVAETWEQAREVMVMGESGLLACSPPDRRPEWVASRHKLFWANGAEAQLFSAADPPSLRGPQFDCAWSDELAKWRRAGEAWDMLQFGLRLGARPRQIVTTTPRDMALLRAILDDPATVATSAPTEANRANLAPSFLGAITRRYRGTHLGRQELGGEMLGEAPDALFRRASIEAARVTAGPEMDRIVVGVDPPATAGPASDECGIVVVGRAGEAFYVLDDCSLGRASPAVWAARAVEASRRWRADRIVAETNQGGEMVIATLRRIDPHAPVMAVRATRGKAARAEPVSALYEQGLVRHVGVMATLEDQLCAFGGGGRSPDRVDALVWAVTALIEGGGSRPAVRSL